MNKKFLSVITTLIFVASILFPTASGFAAGTPPVTVAPASAYGIVYQVHGQYYGWTQDPVTSVDNQDISTAPVAGTTGESKRLEAVKITGTNLPAGASITYEVHGQYYGWTQDPVTSVNNQDINSAPVAGTTGESKRLEAVKIAISGLPGYEVVYQVHGQYYGWTQDPVTSVNNQDINSAPVAGTTGESKRIEAIKIAIVKTDAEKAAEVTAINAVMNAETTKTTADVTAATTAIQAVKDTVENSSLTAKVAAINVNLAVTSVSAINGTVNGTVTVTMSAPPVTPVVGDFKITNAAGDVITPTAIATTGSVVTLTVPTIAATAADQSIVYSVSYKTATAVAAPAFTVAAPAVSSVKAINATQIEVAFNTALDTTDATANDKVTVGELPLAAPVLSTDGKTITLTTNSNTPIDVTNATVQVLPIKTKADTSLLTAKYVGLLTFKDTVKPTITSVTCATSGSTASTVVVKASEPIAASTTTIKIDGVSQGTIADFAGTNTATITGLALSTTATHTIEILTLTDLAATPNVTAYTSQSFTVTTDTVKPTVTLSANSDKTILVTFSKSMDAGTVATALATGKDVVKDEALATLTHGTATIVDATDNKQFTIAVTDPSIFADTTTRTFTVVFANTIKDSLGNAMAATTQSVVLTKDTTKPAANAFSVTKDAAGKITAIKVNFSEGLKAADSGTIDGPTVVNSNGVLVTLPELTSTAVLAGEKSVTWTCTPTAVSGVYSFSFGSAIVSDQAETANTNAAFSYSYNMGTTTTTGFNLATVLNDASTPTPLVNVIKVDYGIAVKGGAVVGSATLLTSYIMNGRALPDGTTITLSEDQRIATITFPSQGIVATDPNAVFTVVGVQSLTGVTVNTHISYVAIVDNTAPTATVVHNATEKTITYTFSEPVKFVNGADTLVTSSANLTTALGIYVVTGTTYNPTSPVASPTINSAVFDSTGKILTITYTGIFAAGKYVVDAQNYHIQDLAGNEVLSNATQMFTVN